MILETFIFGEGVNDDPAVVDSLLFDKFLVLPAFKFIRLSFCTLLFLTKYEDTRSGNGT